MKPAPFAYARPTTVDEVCSLLAKHGEDAKLLAGGQSLMPVLRLRLNSPSTIIDLGRIEELRGVRDDGDALVVGAMTTHHDVMTYADRQWVSAYTFEAIRQRLADEDAQFVASAEEQKEQLEDEILEVGMEIETAKQKAVSAQSLTESLTTFGDLYREALPEERRELIRLRVNQLIWTPDEIRLALLDQPEACQELVESQHLVARTGFEPVLPA